MKTFKLKAELEVKEETPFTKFVTECITYWNREGFHVYISNLEGELGNKETQQLAKDKQYSDWILDMILCDAQTFAKPNEESKKYSLVKDDKKLEAGRTSSHVWIHEDDNRVMMIHVV